MNHSPNITPTHDDFTPLLSLLRTDSPGEGLRSEEIAEQLGVSVETARKELGKAKAKGLVRRTEKRIECLDGRWRTVAAYVMEANQ